MESLREGALVTRARGGDRDAFDALVTPHLAALRSLALRIVGHPDDAEDLVQEALVRAYGAVDGFRGDASFRTWLFAITTRQCLSYLKAKQRWPVVLQLQMHERAEGSEPFKAALGAELSHPEFSYEVGEHIAYCFTCVARSLEPEEAAALLLREAFGFSNAEAAQALEVNEPVLRHCLSRARSSMIEAFDGLCALVSQRGVCHQCEVLRDMSPAFRRGPGVADVLGAGSDAFGTRLRVVRDADLVGGKSHRLHAVMLRFIGEHVH